MANEETLEQLRAQLAAIKQDVAQEEAHTVQFVNEVDQASERWHLWNEIAVQRVKLLK